MISAYKKTDIGKLDLLEAAKKLKKEGFIASDANLLALENASILYHPGWIMRILLFIAGYIGFSGMGGLWMLAMEKFLENHWKAMLILTGILGLIAFEVFLVRNLKHFKSGLTEVILYHSVGLLAGGLAANFQNFEAFAALLVSVVCLLAAIRYLDKTLTLVSVLAFAVFLFLLCMKFGGFAEQIIPFVIIIAFGVLYYLTTQLEKRESLSLWLDQINVLQALSLIFIYAGGNYFVVRELGQEFMNLDIEPGKDIAFAWIFYGLTVLVPLLYLFYGVKNRDRILLWVGFLAGGFSVFTFKYYYSLGYPEVTITVSGALLLGAAIFLLNKLKKPIHGITRERLGVSDLDALTAEGIFISQTIGSVTTGQQQDDLFQGGDFGGGGASGNF